MATAVASIFHLCCCWLHLPITIIWVCSTRNPDHSPSDQTSQSLVVPPPLCDTLGMSPSCTDGSGITKSRNQEVWSSPPLVLPPHRTTTWITGYSNNCQEEVHDHHRFPWSFTCVVSTSYKLCTVHLITKTVNYAN